MRVVTRLSSIEQQPSGRFAIYVHGDDQCILIGKIEGYKTMAAAKGQFTRLRNIKWRQDNLDAIEADRLTRV